MGALDNLISYSREIGANPDWVIAGGGNTSCKEGNSMWVKASGTRLATIERDGFARMDRTALNRIWSANYPSDVAEREARALADLLAATLPDSDESPPGSAGGPSAPPVKRPSVETMMHALIEPRFVVHTHATLVNGISCSQAGEEAARDVFGDDMLWIPTVNPGYVLALTMKAAIDAYLSEHGTPPKLIILQNHGLVVSNDSLDGIRTAHTSISARIRHRLGRTADLTPVATPTKLVGELSEAISACGAEFAFRTFVTNREIRSLAEDRDSLTPVSSAFSPDHIVYAGAAPCFVEDSTSESVRRAIDGYRRKFQVAPKTVVVRAVGAFGCGATEVASVAARDLFLDAVKIAAFAESFGGPKFLPDSQIDFIRNWEVEVYRAKKSAS